MEATLSKQRVACRLASPFLGLITPETSAGLVQCLRVASAERQAPQVEGIPNLLGSTALVEGSIEHPSRRALGSHLPKGSYHNRRFQPRLGSSLERDRDPWSVVRTLEVSPHQCSGTQSSGPRPSALLASAFRQARVSAVRQHHGCGVYQPPGRPMVPSPSPDGNTAVALGTTAFSLSARGSPTGQSQLRSGSPVQRRSSCRRMASSPSGGRAHLGMVRHSASRSLRFARDHALSPMVLGEGPRQPPGGGCTGSRMAARAPVCLSTDSDAPRLLGEGQGRASDSDSDRSSVASENMVPESGAIVARSPEGAPSASGPVVPSSRRALASEPQTHAVMGLAPERERLSALGLSTAVISTIQSARAPSTRSQYAYKWQLFQSWCLAEGHDPVSCPMAVILQFLQKLLDKGKSPSTLKVYLAAISACHVRIDGFSPGCHFLASQFLKGARRLRPPRTTSLPSWSLDVVLEALAKAPFEPLHSVDMKLISIKTAFLLAVVSAKRVSELHALSVHPSCTRFAGDGSKVSMRPNPAFLPKVISPFHMNQSVELMAFHPPPFSSPEEERLHMLCPVRAVRCYIDRTRTVRQTEQLFICHGSRSLGQPLSKQRLSHWIVDAIKLAYESAGLPPPGQLKAHSTRGMATSWALFRGVPVSDICAAASWATPHTFMRFYRLNVLDSSAPLFGASVLHSMTPQNANI